jgi:hypothetical protein
VYLHNFKKHFSCFSSQNLLSFPKFAAVENGNATVQCHSEEQESAIVALSCDVGISLLEIAASPWEGFSSLPKVPRDDNGNGDMSRFRRDLFTCAGTSAPKKES